MGRILIVAAIAALAVWHFAGPAVGSSGSGGVGTSKAEDAVRTSAALRQFPVDDVSCSKSSVAASSISYLKRLDPQGTGSTTMYDCAVTLTSLGMAPQTWCVPGFAADSRPWAAVFESCQAWADGRPVP